MDLGAGAGRIVLLREVSDPTPELRASIDATRRFTHPQLLKLVGATSDGAGSYVASEYLPGVSLFELTTRVRARQRPFEASAAVRVTLDALRLVQRVEALLREAGRPRVRLLFPDCVWIADYGETLLAEAGVAAYLASGRSAQTSGAGAEAIERDVMTAIVELFQLASAQLMTGDLALALEEHLPPDLAGALRAVLLVQGAPADQLATLIEGLAALPPELVGTESQVAGELRRIAPELLDERQNKLAELRGRDSPDLDSPTKIYGADVTAGLDPDEITVEVRKAFRGRPVPARPATTPSRASTAPRIAPRSSRPTPSTPSTPSTSRRAPVARGSRISRQRLVWVLALLLLAGAVVASFVNPAWVRELAARVRFGD